jgi:glycosyltransferase involved in cell wall biosynthesis
MKADCPVLQPRDLQQTMVSCVVPAYNEQENLALLLPRLQAVLTQIGADWEVIVVDDGSRDATATLMTAWTQNPGFRYIQLSRNFGKEPTITAGIEAAVGDAVLILDADLQHPPELLPEMLSRCSSLLLEWSSHPMRGIFVSWIVRWLMPCCVYPKEIVS